MKFKQPDGTVLPQGTTVSVLGKRRVFKDPSGRVIQLQTGRGAVSNPLTSWEDLPAGAVDPALTYQMDAANRGLGYQEQDYTGNWGGFRQLADGSIERPGDLNGAGRGVRDYFQNFDRLNHQYDEQKGDTSRGYQQLGNSQLQSINQRGLLSGGALAQALAKRTENEGRDQERIQYARSGSLSDLLTNTSRAASDAYTGYSRAVGENAPYQATLQTQAIQGAQGYLADDPNYEVINGVLYLRTPGGGVKPVAAPKPSGGAGNGVPGSNVGRGTGGIRAPQVGGLARVPNNTPSLDDRRGRNRGNRRRGRQTSGGGFTYG